MKYWKQGFYDAPIDGAVEITEERWHELLDGQAAGMMITENEQGVPILTECVDDTPAPTYEQQVQSLIWERYSIADEPMYTAAALAATNPVLFAGEVVYESDTSRHKIGDGVKAWNALPYAGGGILRAIFPPNE